MGDVQPTSKERAWRNGGKCHCRQARQRGRADKKAKYAEHLYEMQERECPALRVAVDLLAGCAPLCFCMLPKKMGQLNDDLGEGGERECEEKGDQKQHCSINILPNSLNGMGAP